MQVKSCTQSKTTTLKKMQLKKKEYKNLHPNPPKNTSRQTNHLDNFQIFSKSVVFCFQVNLL